MMKQVRRFTAVSSVLCAALLGTGCASITGSQYQPIAVTAVCDEKIATGSTCTLKNDKGEWQTKTPQPVTVHKSYQDLAVFCRKELASGTSIVPSKSNAGVWGNIVAGGLIGYAVDSARGAGFDYPANVTVQMRGKCPKR